jgi:hypothetical protein
LLSLACHVYHPSPFTASSLRLSSCEQGTRKCRKPYGHSKRNLQLYSSTQLVQLRMKACVSEVSKAEGGVVKADAWLNQGLDFPTVRTDGVDLRQTKSDSRQALLIDPTSGVPGTMSFPDIVSIRALWKAECRQGRKVGKPHVFFFVCARAKGLRASLCWQPWLRRVRNKSPSRTFWMSNPSNLPQQIIATLTQSLGEAGLDNTYLRAIQYQHAHLSECVVSENDMSVSEVISTFLNGASEMKPAGTFSTSSRFVLKQPYLDDEI